MRRYTFTSESVTEGHPDKFCDQISDRVLDAHLAGDPLSRVACEAAAASGLVVVMGEITSNQQVDYQAIARQVMRDVGYTKENCGLDPDTCPVLVHVHAQSGDIKMGVDSAAEGRAQGEHDIGAGDQGMMFGYATDETPERMPLPVALSHRLTRRLSQVRKEGILPYLRPDGKAQVSVIYEDGEPVAVSAVVLSTQHDPDVDHDTIEKDMLQHVIHEVIPEKYLSEDTVYHINPTGRFVIGGPEGDSGLTGRKIIVDTYGGFAKHGGGAFSGKDPTKVDRSASYMCRYVAKNVVNAGLARRCEVGVAYAIGVARPVSLYVDTFGTGVMEDDKIEQLVREVFDFRPAAIIDRLQLRRPIYSPVAAYGHFGREDVALPWEQSDAAEELREKAGL